MSDWTHAREAYGLAIEADKKRGNPPSARNYFDRGQAYEQLGLTDKAQADYRESCHLQQLGCGKLH